MSIPLRSSKDFGALIRDRRAQRGWSQQALADAVGVSRWWINQVERGKPRAELGLVLRVLAVVGVRLTADERVEVPDEVDIDAIVERTRSSEP